MTFTDFRPHWNGNLVNVFTGIIPAATRAETEGQARHCSRQMALWISKNRDEFGAEDRFQLIVFFPLSVRKYGRQIVKLTGDLAAVGKIADGTTGIELRPKWDHTLFQITNSEPAAGRNAG